MKPVSLLKVALNLDQSALINLTFDPAKEGAGISEQGSVLGDRSDGKTMSDLVESMGDSFAVKRARSAAGYVALVRSELSDGKYSVSQLASGRQRSRESVQNRS